MKRNRHRKNHSLGKVKEYENLESKTKSFSDDDKFHKFSKQKSINQQESNFKIVKRCVYCWIISSLVFTSLVSFQKIMNLEFTFENVLDVKTVDIFISPKISNILKTSKIKFYSNSYSSSSIFQNQNFNFTQIFSSAFFFSNLIQFSVLIILSILSNSKHYDFDSTVGTIPDILKDVSFLLAVLQLLQLYCLIFWYPIIIWVICKSLYYIIIDSWRYKYKMNKTLKILKTKIKKNEKIKMLSNKSLECKVKCLTILSNSMSKSVCNTDCSDEDRHLD